MKDTGIQRVVPNIYSNDIESSKQFYNGFLGMKLAMDMGWILTFISNDNPTAQISVFKNTGNKPLDNTAIFISVEVSNVDYLYNRAKEQKIEIVYPLTNEEWGVRRFFVKDPNGATINILMHL
ncbi:VOC family protein [Galbibacter pacificus]|uniref:VOC family protein n=1 Tax=Galbibacter pacificus TaxID=2996052 RepID=A0ABT6FPQ7_9FLAO|nr:VOC family protein [Galbibacter pacificus]MDG3582272.1 VOC family protein [Galbibacter pacificus]MDG3585252.1 VOC family protein [Galbibacter pacificus]